MAMRLSMWVCRLLGFIFKLLYGFRVEGAENVPREGPYIVVYNEFSLLCSMCEAVASSTLLKEPFLQCKVLTFVGEELWALPYFSFAFTKMIPAFPLRAHGAGLYALSLLDGLEHLRQGGVVIINPEGDMSRDGRPVPIRGGAAWLGLHSAAPLVPIIVSASAYDVWPPWQMRPSLRGQIVQLVGKPFKLSETPLEAITDEDLARANARIRTEIDRLWYGPGGVTEWAGPPLRDGVPLEQPIQLRPASEPVVVVHEEDDIQVPMWKRGIPLLLWRCPICHTNDALVHERPLFRPQTLRCRACGTRWAIRRVPGRDLRLRVVDGPAELVGLDMALSTWYDEMKRGFKLSSIPVTDMDLLPDEQVYLRAKEVVLVTYRSSALFNGWTGREPPRAEFPRRSQPADWARLGTGELLLTNRRLVWEGPQGGLDFWWSSVTAVSLLLYYLLGINYGITPYRFILGQENGLKWLTYAGTVAQQVAAQNGHKVTLSLF